MENKHQSYDLAQMQALPLEAKITMTQARIRSWYEHWNGDVYVSVSGGKDSQVLAHIVKEMYPNIPCVFVNTGLEFDSVREKGYELADEVLRPEMDFASVIKNYGYPIISKEVSLKVSRIQNKQDSAYLKYFDGSQKGKSMFDHSGYKWLLDAPFRISNMCCDITKKKPAKKYVKETNRTPFIGTMASESSLRKKEWIKNGCNAFDKKEPSSQPMSFWTDKDVWEYIEKYGLSIADAYKTESRTGCVFCMFGIRQDKDRFLRLKEIEPQKYDYVMRGGKFDENGMWIPYNGLGYKFVIDWLNEHGNLGIKY